MIMQDLTTSWDNAKISDTAQVIREFFKEKYGRARLLGLYDYKFAARNAFGWTRQQRKEGEVSRLLFGGADNPDFSKWVADCIEQIPQNPTWIFRAVHITDWFFAEIEVDNFFDLIMNLNNNDDQSVEIVDLNSSQLFDIGNDGEWDSLLVLKQHPAISRESFVKVYDFIEGKVLVPGNPEI
jgi:hypothetical protein